LALSDCSPNSQCRDEGAGDRYPPILLGRAEALDPALSVRTMGKLTTVREIRCVAKRDQTTADD